MKPENHIETTAGGDCPASSLSLSDYEKKIKHLEHQIAFYTGVNVDMNIRRHLAECERDELVEAKSMTRQRIEALKDHCGGDIFDLFHVEEWARTYCDECLDRELLKYLPNASVDASADEKTLTKKKDV